MKDLIRENINQPEELERLYRLDRKKFEKNFFEVFPEIAGEGLAEFWKVRLESERQRFDLFRAGVKDLAYLALGCSVAGFLIKLPAIINMGPNQESFYLKNVGLIVFWALSLYSILSRRPSRKVPAAIAGLIFIVSAVFINLLPAELEVAGVRSDSVFLACLHLPLMLWCLYGLVYSDFDFANRYSRVEYIKYNGDLAVLFVLIAIAGGVLVGITLGLFEAIGLEIENIIGEWVVPIGAVSAPIVATFIIRSFPQVTEKIPGIIANLFAPLVLIMLVVYLVSMILTGKDPFIDREFLLILNVLLIGVVGIVVFAISETSSETRLRLTEMTLLGLVSVSLIVDLIALAAIAFRLGKFGLTPNRTAVLGANLLILGNLVLMARDLWLACFKREKASRVELTLAGYLPLYAAWTVIVVFFFPVIFGFR